MEIRKGIRFKIFLLFSIMGIVPFAILVILVGYKAIDELEENDKDISRLRSAIISEYVTNIIDKNQAVLESLSMSPNLIEYVQNPTPEKHDYVSKILKDMDDIFKDTNVTALTGADGWQIIRTDGGTLVNIKKRQHFQEAMRGRTYVSDIISSMSSGKMIIVLEVPVFNAEGKPVGLVQRNFDLLALREFIDELDDSESSIVIMDRTGRVIVNSDNVSDVGNEFNADSKYESILERVYNASGVLQVEIDGERALATYSRNIDTGWMIVIIRPYHYIMDNVYTRSLTASFYGFIVVIIGLRVPSTKSLTVTTPFKVSTSTATTSWGKWRPPSTSCELNATPSSWNPSWTS